MPTLLALDTSTEACSCALLHNAEVVERYEMVPRQHTRLMLPMIDSMMASSGLRFADLDAIAFGMGPGSFTGLRIAAGITQGLAFAADLPVLPVSTLAAVALQAAAEDDTLVLSCLDARIDEIYWGWYHVRSGMPTLLGEERLCQPEAIPAELPRRHTHLQIAGNGLLYRERLPASLLANIDVCKPDLLPRSSAIVRIAAQLWHDGRAIAPELVNPVYLRDKVTHA